jgi:hypothetical protein
VIRRRQGMVNLKRHGEGRHDQQQQDQPGCHRR